MRQASETSSSRTGEADDRRPEAPLAPEYEAIAQVIASYLKRANVRLIVVEPAGPAGHATLERIHT